ncbi:calcium/sodium antiporter [Segatella albensis]|uniref:calcium/sodium antiporter n=1 Tax=Segatella albensis TaxID=77768 RepID=UPI000407FAB6|nr:calcium/sodium antiporter [Segatella albensis]
MILNLVFIVVGIALVLWGADRLTDGAVALADRMGISQIVIGLTVVAMGTSMPEFTISLLSAIKGTSGLAVGNVIGSNIFNSLLIVGTSAVVAPMLILKSTVRKDIPFALVASVMLYLLSQDGQISRWDAAILFVFFMIFMTITIKESKSADSKKEDTQIKSIKVWKAVAFLLIGLTGLILGSNIFVNGATKLATTLGVSDAVIGLTIVAGGTSLPELATSVVASRKGNSGIAIGNVLGSNVFNILMILGITGLITPMSIHGITQVDLTMLVVSMILLWLFSFTKYRIERWEGAILSILFIGYIVYLILQI